MKLTLEITLRQHLGNTIHIHIPFSFRPLDDHLAARLHHLGPPMMPRSPCPNGAILITGRHLSTTRGVRGFRRDTWSQTDGDGRICGLWWSVFGTGTLWSLWIAGQCRHNMRNMDTGFHQLARRHTSHAHSQYPNTLYGILCLH